MLPWIALLAAGILPGTATDYKQPQLAASGSTVSVTFGAGDAIYYAASTDHGHTFSRPAKVADLTGLSLGMHRGPRVAISGKTIVIAAIAGKAAAETDRNLVAWRSTDGGHTWSAPVVINDQPGATREGLHALAAAPDGTLYTVWLDLRSKGMRLYGAASHDGGATWSRNFLVYESPDGAICNCCHPSLAIDAKGRVVAMWRNALGGNRDMYVSSSTDGGTTWTAAEKLGAGSWPLNACPMDGGGLALDVNGKIVSSWRRGSDVYLAKAGASEMELATGKNPAIATNAQGVFAAWQTGAGVFARVPGQDQPVLLDHEGGFVQLIAPPAGPVVAAWERNGTIQFRVFDEAR